MKTTQELITDTYKKVLLRYLIKYKDSIALTKEDDQYPINEELQNIKNHCSKNPELYGGTDRLARTDAQWQKRIEYIEEKEHLLTQTIESQENKLLRNCILRYKKIYPFSREGAIAQIEKEFSDHCSASNLSASDPENRVAWLATLQESLEKEEILQNELVKIMHEVKSSRKSIDQEDDVLNQELLDDANKGFLKSSIQRIPIFEEYRDRLAKLRDNYIHNTQGVKATAQECEEKFVPSNKKLGRIKSTISYDERTMIAQQEASSNLKPQPGEKRKADEALTSKEDSQTTNIADHLLDKNPSSSKTHKRHR